MLILTADEVRKSLPMDQAIEAVKRAFAALSTGKAEVPLRAHLPVPPHEAMTLCMTAYVRETQGEALAVKVVSVFPHNPKRNLPLISAAVLVLEADTGRPFALIEGGSLTAIRTGAASGAATDLLARKDSQVVAIFGAGVQGRTQLEAICAVRSIQTVWIYDPDREQVQRFIKTIAGQTAIPKDIRIAENPRQAASEADIICTATTSQKPVFDHADLIPGVHINGVGSYTPEMQEIPAQTILQSYLVVDSRQAALAEAGDLIQAIQAGLIRQGHIQAEIGEIISGDKPGRTYKEQITFFKSVGNAVQDAAAAQLALQNAHEMGLGQEVDW